MSCYTNPNRERYLKPLISFYRDTFAIPPVEACPSSLPLDKRNRDLVSVKYPRKFSKLKPHLVFCWFELQYIKVPQYNISSHEHDPICRYSLPSDLWSGVIDLGDLVHTVSRKSGRLVSCDLVGICIFNITRGKLGTFRTSSDFRYHGDRYWKVNYELPESQSERYADAKFSRNLKRWVEDGQVVEISVSEPSTKGLCDQQNIMSH